MKLPGNNCQFWYLVLGENYFVKDYEKPLKNFIELDTTHQTEKESLNEILNVYR